MTEETPLVDHDMYRIDFATIAALPEGRQRAVLARKALAAFFGYQTTAALKTYGQYDEKPAIEHLKARVQMGVGWVGIPVGYEPKDTTDRSKDPVSIERFMATVQSAAATKH